MLAIAKRHESLIPLNCQLCLAASVRVSTEHSGLRSRAWARVGRDMVASAVLTINPKNLSFSSGKRADPAHPLRSAEGCAPIALLWLPSPMTLITVTVGHEKKASESLRPTGESSTHK